MTRYQMLDVARRRASGFPFWMMLDAQGKESMAALLVDSFIVLEQIGEEKAALVFGCMGVAAFELKGKGL